MVAVGVEAEQREAEAVLAAGRAVATAGVAAGPHEDRHHVELEADRRIDGRVLYADRHVDVARFERDGEFRVAIGFGQEVVAIALDEIFAVELPGGFVGHVARDAVGELGLDDDRLRIAEEVSEISWIDMECVRLLSLRERVG